jgi:hypothetical protein
MSFRVAKEATEKRVAQAASLRIGSSDQLGQMPLGAVFQQPPIHARFEILLNGLAARAARFSAAS